MIARLMRALWVATLVVAITAVWLSIRWFSSAIGPWAAASAAVFVVVASHPLVIAVNFVLSRLAGDPVPQAYRLSMWQALKTYDAEIDASMRGLWFATPFLARRPLARPPPDRPLRGLPILFVHGYLCNRAIWLSFARDAASRGHPCEAITLDNPFEPIERHAASLDAAIDALLAEVHAAGSGAAQVAIVAHSMGGLVVRAALQRIDATRVVHVITLGTPHHGCFSARLGRFPSVVQMRRDSTWLATLAGNEAKGTRGLPRSAYTTLISYHDDIVYPQETGLLDGAHPIAIGGCGHVALVYDRRVREHVFARLVAIEADIGRRAATADSCRAALNAPQPTSEGLAS